MVLCGDTETLAEAGRALAVCRPMSQNPHNDDDGGGNRRGALIGLVITALLVVTGYYLMTVLRHQGQMEDCLMSGRSNCAPVDIPTHK
jgi:hypothetical protein